MNTNNRKIQSFFKKKNENQVDKIDEQIKWKKLQCPRLKVHKKE